MKIRSVPPGVKNARITSSYGPILPVLAGVLACFIALLPGCSGRGGEPEGTASPSYEVIEIIPGETGAVTNTPDEAAVTETPAPTPTAEPTTAEGRILAGQILPLNNGEPLTASFAGETIDIDGDGAAERLSVLDIDGGPVFCVDGEPFLDVGSCVYLASLDGEHIVFLSQRPGENGYFIFYPDEGGNLFCRLFAIVREGSPEELLIRSSYEEYVRGGMDIMLHNPMLYTAVNGAERKLRLDMDGDGAADEIVFDSETLSVNGLPNGKILSTTMPRFIWDEAHNCIVLSGSAGDYALSLRLSGSELLEDISYANLL